MLPPPFGSGGDGEDKDCVVVVKRAGAKGVAELVDGFIEPQNVRARVPSTLLGSPPCSVVGGRELVEPAMGDVPSLEMAL